jgi:hypothetical protein
MRAYVFALFTALSFPCAAFAQSPPVAQHERASIAHRPVFVAASDEAIVLQATVIFPYLVEHLDAHYRCDGGPWTTVRFERVAEGWSATIPRAGTRTRRVDYHLSVTTRDGATRAVFATREDPHPVAVQTSRGDADEEADLVRFDRRRLEFVVGGEHTSFGARRNTNNLVCGAGPERCDDWWFSVFGEVRYHFFRTARVVSVRVERLQGVTTRGDTAPGLQSIGLVATTTELELRVAPWFIVGLSGILGANEVSVQAGGGTRLELGANSPTRVSIGFRGIVNFGLMASAWLRFDSVPHTPLGVGVEVTNQPGANQNFGVRLLAEAGRRFGRHVTLTVRGGYGARREDASGFSLGGALSVAF